MGCLDGDGCFSILKRGQEIGIHSSYEQDWTHFMNLAKNIGIEYHLERRIAKRGKSSSIRIVKKQSCINFIEFLYPSGYEFGLKRKYDKSLQILNRCKNVHIICNNCHNSIYLNEKINEIKCLSCGNSIKINNHIISRIK